MAEKKKKKWTKKTFSSDSGKTDEKSSSANSGAEVRKPSAKGMRNKMYGSKE